MVLVSKFVKSIRLMGFIVPWYPTLKISKFDIMKNYRYNNIFKNYCSQKGLDNNSMENMEDQQRDFELPKLAYYEQLLAKQASEKYDESKNNTEKCPSALKIHKSE